jgi:hypothetical protein
MDFISDADLLSKLLATLVGLMTAVFAFFRWVRPRVKRAASDIQAGRDALIGREAIYDSITGKELVPALPGIGVRMSTNEAQLTVLADAVAKLADNHDRLNDHEARIKHLEEGLVERVVTRAESTAAWRAVEAIATQPAEHDAPIPGLGEN